MPREGREGSADRARWDRRYREGSHTGGDAPAWLEQVAQRLPVRGRALDVAAGSGRIACWLAARALDTLAVDISAEGLRLCRERAQRSGVSLRTQQLDLESQPLPDGPFDLISCFAYLQRDLFEVFPTRLAPGGVLLCEIKTKQNLERHEKPSAGFLLEPGELRSLCAPLEIISYEEGWFGDLALARVVARGS